MDKHRYLVELSGSERTDFGRTEFREQEPNQQVFSAVWPLENGVNHGGFASYFGSRAGGTAAFAPVALDQIGACKAAAIVRRALGIMPGPLPQDRHEREAMVRMLADGQAAALDELRSEFMACPDDLTQRLFAFVASRPESFGPV